MESIDMLPHDDIECLIDDASEPMYVRRLRVASQPLQATIRSDSAANTGSSH